MSKETLQPVLNAEITEFQKHFLETVGLWDSQKNKEKYAFRLSPDVLEFTKEQKAELEEINSLMFGENGFLKGSLRIFSRIFDPKFTSTHAGGKIARTLTVGIPKAEQDIHQICQLQIPAIVRLDLVLAEKTKADDPSFKIVEVEGDKTHAFGYVTIADIFGQRIAPQRERTQGLIPTLKAILEQEQIPSGKSVALIVGTNERFYEQELGVFASLARGRESILS